jgi:alpha-L-fucosidase
MKIRTLIGKLGGSSNCGGEESSSGRRERMFVRRLPLIVCLSAAALLLHTSLVHVQADAPNSLAFRPGTNGSFTFDTGELRGVLREEGRSFGLQSVIHIPTGRRLDAGNGLFGHYRTFTTGKRYGDGAWNWPSTARLTEGGAVEVLWPVTEDRPFELRAVYRWAKPTVLDLETTVTAKQNLSKFESFLASYFDGGFSNAMAAVVGKSDQKETPQYLSAVQADALWHMFPRDDAAVSVIQDGRWQLLPHPVDWTIRPRLQRPVAIRCDKVSNLAALVMGTRDECFAVAMPHETEGHYSLYLSQFGRDLKAGETACAQARLVILDRTDQEGYDRAWVDFAYKHNPTLTSAQAEKAAPEPWLRDRLEWFQDLKFGLFTHWGAYSQWGCIESWPLVEEDTFGRPDDLPAWIKRGKDLERFQRDYWALPRTFNPTNFNPEVWARAAKQAGMKYFVFTTKHHDGFAMFDTKHSDYRITSPDVSFHSNQRSNVVREVFNVFRKEGFAIGAYFSKSDWRSSDYWDPSRPARTRNPNYDTLAEPDKWRRFVKFAHGQVEELMSGYGPVDILWLDGGQVRPPQQDLQMDRLAAMARTHQPRLIIVDRSVGGRYENYHTPEQEVPDKPLPYTWETCMTMGDQWSFKPDDRYKSAHRLIQLLVDIVAKGGNFLLNIGPQPDGRMPEVVLDRLREIGDWMRVNGEAIYGTRPIAPYKEGSVAFTCKGRTIHAIYLPEAEGGGLPERVVLTALRPAAGSTVRMLGVREPLAWSVDDQGRAVIDIPASVRQSPPCRHAFVFQFEKAP